MARYTPAFLAALRQRYEQTHQSERSIAWDFGIGASTVRRIAGKEGWARPPQPWRDLEPSMRLLEKTRELGRRIHAQRGLPPLREELPPRIPVARYTPDLMAALRRCYEHTQQSARAIAFDFGVSDRTLRRIAATRGWLRPRPARRDLAPAARLAEEAAALRRRFNGPSGRR